MIDPAHFGRRRRLDASLPSWPLALALMAASLAMSPAGAETPALKIAAVVSRTGPGAPAGVPVLEAIELAVDEASAAHRGRIELDT